MTSIETGLIVPKIEELLRGETIIDHAGLNTLSLVNSLHGMGDAFIKQFIDARRERSYTKIVDGEDETVRPDDIFVTDVSHPCCRKVAFKVWEHGDREPLEPRARLKFFFGDVLEAGVLALAKLAGCDIRAEQMRVTYPQETPDGIGYEIRGKIDGLLVREEEKIAHIVEVKTTTGAGFKKWQHQGADNEWGYLTQATMYQPAVLDMCMEKGWHLGDTIFLVLSTDTGHMLERAVPNYSSTLFHAAVGRAATAVMTQGGTAAAMELAPLSPVDEVRKRQKNKVKFDEPTGRTLLCKQCSYCEWKRECWDFEVETKSGRPIYIVGGESDAGGS